MQLENLHKYISLRKKHSGIVEAMYSGQVFAFVTESGDNYTAYVNPVFMKLVAGAETYYDVPTPTVATSIEEAIANVLQTLHSLNCFKEYDTEIGSDDGMSVADKAAEALKEEAEVEEEQIDELSKDLIGRAYRKATDHADLDMDDDYGHKKYAQADKFKQKLTQLSPKREVPGRGEGAAKGNYKHDALNFPYRADAAETKKDGTLSKRAVNTAKYVANMKLGKLKDQPKPNLPESEQIEELSKTTLASYAKKAQDDADKQSKASVAAWEKGDKEASDKHFNKMSDRAYKSGVAAAKASMKEESEQIEELSRSTLDSYTHASFKDRKDLLKTARTALKAGDQTGHDAAKAKAARRDVGFHQAHARDMSIRGFADHANSKEGKPVMKKAAKAMPKSYSSSIDPGISAKVEKHMANTKTRDEAIKKVYKDTSLNLSREKAAQHVDHIINKSMSEQVAPMQTEYSNIFEAYKAKMQEKLSGNQHKLDINCDGKISADDLHRVRKGHSKDCVKENLPPAVIVAADREQGSDADPKNPNKKSVKFVPTKIVDKG